MHCGLHAPCVAQACTLTGFTAEISPAHNCALLPELAWNLAVWQRLQSLEARLGYTFRDKRLLREVLYMIYRDI